MFQPQDLVRIHASDHVTTPSSCTDPPGGGTLLHLAKLLQKQCASIFNNRISASRYIYIVGDDEWNGWKASPAKLGTDICDRKGSQPDASNTLRTSGILLLQSLTLPDVSGCVRSRAGGPLAPFNFSCRSSFCKHGVHSVDCLVLHLQPNGKPAAVQFTHKAIQASRRLQT